MFSQTLKEWVPNLWTSGKPLVNIATGKEASTSRMVKNFKTLSMDLSQGLHFKKKILFKMDTMIALKNRKLYNLS